MNHRQITRRGRIVRALLLLRGALREIFDESAYARFLTRQHVPSSPAAYRAFLRECGIRKARQARCC